MNDIASVALVCGIPGSGKSTICRDMAHFTGFKVISSEEVRASILGKEHEYSDRDFTDDELQTTYKSIFKMTDHYLSNKVSLILDGFFRSFELRHRIEEIAQAHDAPFQGFCVYCDYEVALRRVQKRKLLGTKSPTGPDNLRSVWALFETPKSNYIFIDNNQERRL